MNLLLFNWSLLEIPLDELCRNKVKINEFLNKLNYSLWEDLMIYYDLKEWFVEVYEFGFYFKYLNEVGSCAAIKMQINDFDLRWSF